MPRSAPFQEDSVDGVGEQDLTGDVELFWGDEYLVIDAGQGVRTLGVAAELSRNALRGESRGDHLGVKGAGHRGQVRRLPPELAHKPRVPRAVADRRGPIRALSARAACTLGGRGD